MKKNAVIILIVSMTVLLSGCIKFDIDTGIDADFNAYLSYHIEMDVSELDLHYQSVLRNALNEIGWYYQEELGFIVELKTESDPYMLKMTKRVANDSIEQAYVSLEQILTNEDITAFTKVDMALYNSDRQSRYIFNAEADIPQVIRISNAEELPPALQLNLGDAMEAGEGSITLSLPASELISASHQVNVQNNQAVMVVPLSFAGQTAFELTGVINMLRDGTPGGPIDEILQELTTYRNIAVLACGAAVVVLLIAFLALSLTKRRRFER